MRVLPVFLSLYTASNSIVISASSPIITGQPSMLLLIHVHVHAHVHIHCCL